MKNKHPLEDLIVYNKIKYLLNPKHLPQFSCWFGATRCGKTIWAMIKLYLMISDLKQDAMLGVANISRCKRDFVDHPLSITKLFNNVSYRQGSGGEGAHFLIRHKDNTVNRIHVSGYTTATDHEKKLLGTSIKIHLIDEVSAAHPNYLEETIERVISNNGHFIGCSNGSYEAHPMYNKLVYKCSPESPFKDHIPDTEITKFRSEFSNSSYIHWNLLNDAPHMTDKQRQALIDLYVPGSFRYASKILGTPANATGAVYDVFVDDNKRFITDDLPIKFKQVFAGLDIGADYCTISLVGQDLSGNIYVIDEWGHSNKKNPNNQISIRDFYNKILEMTSLWHNKYKLNAVYFEYATAGNLMLIDYLRDKHKYGMANVQAYETKKPLIIDRIIRWNHWFSADRFKINSNCKQFIREMNSSVWTEPDRNGKSERSGTDDHYLNSVEYAMSYIWDI